MIPKTNAVPSKEIPSNKTYELHTIELAQTNTLDVAKETNNIIRKEKKGKKNIS